MRIDQFDSTASLEVTGPGMGGRPINSPAAQPSTFVFGPGGVHSGSDEHHQRAIGVGIGRDAARMDAARRLKERYPGLRSSAHGVAPELAGPYALLSSLLARTDIVHFARQEGFPEQSSLGHEYMSNETYFLASMLQADDEVCRRLAVLSDRCVASVKAAVGLEAAKLTRSIGFDPGMLDWAEISSALIRCIDEAQRAGIEPGPRRERQRGG